MVESVGVKVLQDVLRGVRVIDGLVVRELLNKQRVGVVINTMLASEGTEGV